jgi:DNA-binding HxlR family transcriptional regulator
MLVINDLKIKKMPKKNYADGCTDVVCSVDYAFKRIGGKYKGRILWNLSDKTILRYGELRKTLMDVTPKMLTQTLRELEDDELVSRKVYHEVPPKVEYSLTDIGMELIPFINHLKEWGDKQRAKEKI